MTARLPPLALLALSVAACGEEHDHGDEANALFERAFEETDLGKQDSSGCSGVVVPDKSGFAKRVALTFDDGPNPTTTPKVLDVLAEHGVKATFFINGTRVKGDAERAILARILDEGHILASHSQNHLDLKAVSSTKLASEVLGTDTILRAAGVEPRYFRFPFGSASCAGMSYVRSLGYIVTGWHIDSADWCFAKGSGVCTQATFRYVPDAFRRDMAGYVMSQVRAKNGGVLLFHDVHANTAASLDGILSELEDAGFTFVNVDDEATFPKLNGVTPPPALWVGDGCAKDADCNFASEDASATCHRFTPADAAAEVGFCTLACEGYCPDRAGASSTFCTSLDGGLTGRCVARAGAANGNCTRVPGTIATLAARFIGTSSAAAANATVCLPR
ncbi:MAG: polysaccharide deacetylase family protein [Deltaproteobacteria bacterium]|nr:polysaccharide deacetylase family protein [Deltaproteobacteria bacterium]